MQSFNQKTNQRINIFIGFVFLIFILISLRLFQLQIVHGKEYKREGEDQYFYTTGENFDRGAITFSNKNNDSVVVQMTNEYDIAVDPKTLLKSFEKKIESGSKKVDLENEIFNKIDSIFSKNKIENASGTVDTFVTKEIFLEKLNKNDSSYEILVKNVNEEIANEIMSEKFRGIIVNRKKSRVYFEKEVGAKLLGFVGFAGREKTGLYGVEKYYNDVLEKLSASNSNFFAEVFSDFNKEETKTSTLLKDTNIQGDVNLTIDVNVARHLHKVLGNIKTKWNSEKAGGIIMDINDGSILGIDEVPSFDPNEYSKVENIGVYNNDLVSGIYEMGSIIKPLTVAAALDSGVVNEYTTYNDTGMVELNGYKIYNYDKRARGPGTPLQEILSQSLNIGISFLVQKMGDKSFSEYFHKFGLGEYTGVDLPNESAGLVDNLDSHVMVDSVTAGFGQGIAITPVQTIRALASLGNGGKLVTPHVVKSITYDNGDKKVIALDEPEIIFKNPDTSKKISQILTKVVDEGMKAKNSKYTIAAKTGTAQIVNPNTGKYYEDRYLHSFFGYFPATNPKYIIFLYQVYPKGVQYASQSLKDSFFNLVNFLISYYEVPPDR